jgi:putative transposase
MTIVSWMPIFRNPEVAEIVISSLRYLQEKKHAIVYAFVLMENHFHCVVQCDDLIAAIRSFKSFSARTIIDYYKKQNNITILEKFRRNKLPYKVSSNYQVWQEGSHPQSIVSDKMMRQKIEYIHNNPIRHGYVDNAVDWFYSSARSYEGKPGVVNVQVEW